MIKLTANSVSTSVWWCLGIFLLMEIPVRMLLQADPWLLHPSHWYFIQPMRFSLELALAAMLIIVVRNQIPQILVVPKQHWDLLLIASIGSIVLFAFMEFEQLQSSLNVEPTFWLLWFLTGFCIGFAQELLYRGLLFTSLATMMSQYRAGLVSTIIFILAPLHSVRLLDLYSDGHLTLVLVLIGVYFAAGCFFQWLRQRTGSVVIPGVVHGFGNAITWVAVFS